MRISDWSSDVCSSDLRPGFRTRVLDSRGRARQEALSGRRSGLTRMITQRTPVRQLRSERTRKRLLDATIACLVKYGYARTNPLRVAAEAGEIGRVSCRERVCQYV